MLEVRGLRKAFGDRQVLRGVDLAARPGQVLGLVGANGAGKTTLISIVAGLLPADAGEITIEGALGLAPQRLGVYPTLTV